ncbi:GAF domain-containing protein [Halomonas sp. E19]|uniref:GAF domain-containing protein n=1 Tax=Halomonas sp. E19 TaxID=3397247 RepID=UPI0040339A8F
MVPRRAAAGGRLCPGRLPCEHVLHDRICTFPDNLAQRFPADELLHVLGAQSYIGLPLRAPDGSLIGLLAVMRNRPWRFPLTPKRCCGSPPPRQAWRWPGERLRRNSATATTASSSWSTGTA